MKRSRSADTLSSGLNPFLPPIYCHQHQHHHQRQCFSRQPHFNHVLFFLSFSTFRANLKDENLNSNKTKSTVAKETRKNWIQLCFRAKKDMNREPPDPVPPESVVFELSE